MPKKSKKSKSKRMTLRHKYKVIKKVKEHHKKIAKAAKKSGNKPKIAKDPGIPASWPFKEELLKDLEFQKQRILAQEQAKKDAKKARKARHLPIAFIFQGNQCAHFGQIFPFICKQTQRVSF